MANFTDIQSFTTIWIHLIGYMAQELRSSHVCLSSTDYPIWRWRAGVRADMNDACG